MLAFIPDHVAGERVLPDVRVVHARGHERLQRLAVKLDRSAAEAAEPVAPHDADDDVVAGQLRGRALDAASWQPVQLELAPVAAEGRLWPRGQRQADMPDEERT